MRFALVLIACVVSCNGYISFEPPNKEADKGTCISTAYEFGDFKANEKKPVPDKCEIATCEESGGILYEGCGSVALPSDCEWVEPDRSAEFPKCCRYDFNCP